MTVSTLHQEYTMVINVTWLPLADPGGGALGTRAPPLGPISFIFIQFSVKILSNSRFFLRTQGLAPLPRLGNPGSATGFITFSNLGRHTLQTVLLNNFDYTCSQ